MVDERSSSRQQTGIDHVSPASNSGVPWTRPPTPPALRLHEAKRCLACRVAHMWRETVMLFDELAASLVGDMLTGVIHVVLCLFSRRLAARCTSEHRPFLSSSRRRRSIADTSLIPFIHFVSGRFTSRRAKKTALPNVS